MPGTRSDRSGVVVVGSAMVDLVSYVERIPYPGETMVADGFMQGYGGKGANQAAAVALHGVACSMIGAVGDDLFGPATIADLESFGVGTAHVATVPDQATGTATILVEPSGENRIALAPGAPSRSGPTSRSTPPVVATGPARVRASAPWSPPGRGPRRRPRWLLTAASRAD